MIGLNDLNTMISSASEAKQLAKALFIERYPDHVDWFDLVWETLVLQPELNTPGRECVLPGLGVSDRNDSIAREMMKEVVIFFEAFMQKFPAARDELVMRLEATSRRHGKTESAIQVLKKSVSQKVAPTENFMVWYREPEIQRSVRRVHEGDFSRAEVERKFLGKQQAFDIFAHRDMVHVKINGEQREVPLEPRIHRILLILLRHHGDLVRAIPLYRCVWQDASTYTTPRESDVTYLLKPAISALRTGLQGKVQGFKIPKKKPGHGYRCCGDFSFCVIVSSGDAAELAVVS